MPRRAKLKDALLDVVVAPPVPPLGMRLRNKRLLGEEQERRRYNST